MWLFSSHKTRRSTSSRRVAQSLRPKLEVLEDRWLLSAGALDPTFGNGAGYVTTAPPNPSSVRGGEVLVQPDGKIIETGYGFASGKNGRITASDFVAVRFNTDGSLDKSFGSGGIALAVSAQNGTNKTGGVVGFNAVYAFWSALYPSAGTANDGKIVLEGSYPVQSGPNTPFVNELALVRFNANGTLDTSFGSNGEVLTSFSAGGKTLGVSFGAGVVVTSTGQIVECGEQRNAYTVLARFNSNGALDTTFGQGGEVYTPGPDASSLRQQPDGKLIVPASTSTGGAVLRYNSDGTLDGTFGSGGIVTNVAFSYCQATAVYPDGTPNGGKIVVVGGGGGATGGWEVARYDTHGILDSTFGSGGMVNTQTGSSSSSVLLQADGKIVAAGTGSVLVRYNPDGSLDGTFGTGGIVTTTLPHVIYLRNVVLQTNGKILAGGDIVVGSNDNFVLARYLPSEPEIGSFTANPNPVTSGSSETFTVSNITDGNAGATITQVAFYYYDSTGAKHTLGTATQTNPGVWTMTFTVNLTAGGYTIYAQAEDSYGVFGDPLGLSLTVQ
jgi:uncharacterized delta-60 repeat protein